jgi:hypothetical protein
MPEDAEKPQSKTLIKASTVEPDIVKAEEAESARYIPFKVPKTQEEMLEAGKQLGISKNAAVVNGITLINFLNNKAGWHTTKEATFPHELLKNLREHARQQGASVEDLAEIDVAIKHWEDLLKRLEKDGKGRVAP